MLGKGTMTVIARLFGWIPGIASSFWLNADIIPVSSVQG
jgi:hypothetical protein